MGSLEFALGLLDEASPHIAAEDLDGQHAAVLQLWQTMGFVGSKPCMNPVPGCPYCHEGVPYRLGERLLCNACRSTVDPRRLLLWPMEPEAFLRWLASEWQLRGEVRRIDDHLWQLGTWVKDDGPLECFFRRSGDLSSPGRTRLLAYRNTLVAYPRTPIDAGASQTLSLLEAVRLEEGALCATGLGVLLRPRGNVRFDLQSGALWTGDVWLGEAPVGSKEFFFLQRLAEDLDHFVSYADLKHFVLRESGSSDSTDDATFCQLLKSRLKRKWMPKIDSVVASTNKADGYRLRARHDVAMKE